MAVLALGRGKSIENPISVIKSRCPYSEDLKTIFTKLNKHQFLFIAMIIKAVDYTAKVNSLNKILVCNVIFIVVYAIVHVTVDLLTVVFAQYY